MSPLEFAVAMSVLQAPVSQVSQVHLAVDSARYHVLVRVSPLCSGLAGTHARSGHQHSSSNHEEAWLQFRWPVDGWLRGFRVRLQDGENRPLPQTLIHHLVLADLERRQLVHPAIERLFAVGQETEDVMLPKSIGVPLHRGARLALKAACQVVSPGPNDVVSLSLQLVWTPANQVPRPVSVFPFYVDVHLKNVLDTNTFDLPPGRSFTAYDFRIPIAGRLLAVGAHLHDYGVAVRLEDSSSGHVISRLRAKRSATGQVLSVERKLYGVGGRGLRLKAGHPYRLVATYDNPTSDTIVNGGMAHLVGLFEAEDPKQWPVISTGDAALQEDLRRVGGGK